MIINGKNYRTIWLADDKKSIEIIDQRFLPFEFVIEKINNVEEMAAAIKEMHLRGAPLIGAAAGYGIYLACINGKDKKDFDDYIINMAKLLESTRPTAINLKWGLNRMLNEIKKTKTIDEKIETALKTAIIIADEDVEINRNIGLNGVKLIENIAKNKNGKTVEILTHCNAGALATVDIGTATASIYEAFNRKIDIHVWVEETRPRNQGKLTAWELQQAQVPNTVICDNTGGHLMQTGKVDIVIVGTDRTTSNGDVANKIGTYQKALAAADNNIPFYVALPSPTIDWTLISGKQIPIEERTEDEVLYIEGYLNKKVENVRLFAEKTKALNYGFDVTPARLITGLITEKGICKPHELEKFFGKMSV
ncbi:MAG: S-methyl-5-thioribose-1-phosphate isomerase [Spirochaetes bacterium]|nr:S-methyl-5-thioribose-1-phosphate isomerase [Spirochaetota bacterium]